MKIKVLLYLLLLISALLEATVIGEKEFIKRVSWNIREDVKLIGNSVLSDFRELHESDICYIERILDSNGAPLNRAVKKGEILSFEVGITNKSNKLAKGVFIKRDGDAYFEYIANSIYIKQPNESSFSSKTDAIDSDTAEYNSLNKGLSFYLGENAIKGVGGEINKNKIAFFKYQARLINIPTNLHFFNVYKVSYKNEDLGVSFSDIPIRKCEEFNSTIAIKKLASKIKVVESGKNWDSKILTKIVNEPALSFDILLSNKEDTFEPSSGIIKRIRLVDSNDNTLKELISSDINITNSGKLTKSFSFDSAKSVVYFKCTNKDNIEEICSDSFAIRPKEFVIDELIQNSTNNHQNIEEPKIKAGEPFSIVIKAIDYYGNVVTNFNESFELNWSKTGLMIRDGIVTPANSNFNDGISYMNISYDDVGVIELKVKDNESFAAVDKDDFDINDNYIIKGKKSYFGRFIPDHFDLSLAKPKIKGYKNSKFAYYADVNNSDKMGAEIEKIEFNISAKNKNGQITQNYSNDSGFEKDINLLILIPTIPYKHYSNCLNSPINLNFVNGEAKNRSCYSHLILNMPRDSNKTKEPMELNSSNVTIWLKATDSDNVSGETQESIDDYAVLLYARINPIDGESITNIINALIYFEVYAKNRRDLVKKVFNVNSLTPSVNDIYWYQSILHPSNIKIENISGNQVEVIKNNPINGIQQNSYINNGITPRRVLIEIDLLNKEYFYYSRLSGDRNKSSFYLDFKTSITNPKNSPNVLINQGLNTKGASRIGE